MLILCLLVCSSCSETGSNNTAKPSKASPTPTPTEEQKKEAADRNETEKQNAINDYVAKNHKGWTLSGTSNGAPTDSSGEPFGDSDDSKCIADTPCYLHLIQKDKNKVVPVVLRQFKKDDGKTYWFVYDANPVDLAQLRLKLIKDKEHDKTLSKLTIDDCQPVVDAEAEANYDPGDYDNAYWHKSLSFW